MENISTDITLEALLCFTLPVLTLLALERLILWCKSLCNGLCKLVSGRGCGYDQKMKQSQLVHLPNNAKLHTVVVSRRRLAGKKDKEAGVEDLHGDRCKLENVVKLF